MPSLDLIFRSGRHSVIPQIIKAELRARPVRDVTRILRTAFRLRLPVLQTTDRQPKLPVHFPHPVRIPGRQIIVHRHHMNSFTGQRIQIGRQGPHQRLSLSRRHLRDLSRMQDHPADQLHIKRDHLPQNLLPPDFDLSLLLGEPATAVFHHGKRFRQKLI